MPSDCVWWNQIEKSWPDRCTSGSCRTERPNSGQECTAIVIMHGKLFFFPFFPKHVCEHECTQHFLTWKWPKLICSSLNTSQKVLEYGFRHATPGHCLHVLGACSPPVFSSISPVSFIIKQLLPRWMERRVPEASGLQSRHKGVRG